MGFPAKWNKTHLHQWDTSILNQAHHLKRTPMCTGFSPPALRCVCVCFLGWSNVPFFFPTGHAPIITPPKENSFFSWQPKGDDKAKRRNPCTGSPFAVRFKHDSINRGLCQAPKPPRCFFPRLRPVQKPIWSCWAAECGDLPLGNFLI